MEVGVPGWLKILFKQRNYSVIQQEHSASILKVIFSDSLAAHGNQRKKRG
jgi:hypothetical protein